jgi:hypothetical protein
MRISRSACMPWIGTLANSRSARARLPQRAAPRAVVAGRLRKCRLYRIRYKIRLALQRVGLAPSLQPSFTSPTSPIRRTPNEAANSRWWLVHDDQPRLVARYQQELDCRALARAACRANYSVRSYRLPRLAKEVTRHDAHAHRTAFLEQLATLDLLSIDALTGAVVG